MLICLAIPLFPFQIDLTKLAFNSKFKSSYREIGIGAKSSFLKPYNPLMRPAIRAQDGDVLFAVGIFESICILLGFFMSRMQGC